MPKRHLDESLMTKFSTFLAGLTVEEVAAHLGLSEERIRQLIRTKEIKATKIGGWLVRPEDLDEFIRSRTNLNTLQHKDKALGE